MANIKSQIKRNRTNEDARLRNKSAKSAIRTATEKTVHDIFNKNDYKDAGVLKTVVAVREYNKRLGFSEKWTTDFVYRVVMLAKKEKQPQTDAK